MARGPGRKGTGTMNDDEVRRLMAFLKMNGAYIEMHDDALTAWRFALRSFTYDMCLGASLWFLERNHPREVAPATIRAAVKSLTESGRFVEEMCPDHPEEVRRWCRCCLADKLAGHRPAALVGQRLEPRGEVTSRPDVLRHLGTIGEIEE